MVSNYLLVEVTNAEFLKDVNYLRPFQSGFRSGLRRKSTLVIDDFLQKKEECDFVDPT